MTRLFLAAALAFAVPAAAADAPYVTAERVDLLRLLPPPPPAGSAEDRAEMAEVLAIQASRTPDRLALAASDADETLAAMFGAILGPAAAPGRLPALDRLFARLAETEEAVTGPAKSGFARPRPFQANPAVQPGIRLSKSGAWPSGHATISTLVGITLASMLPEQRDAIFARVREYGESRVVGGVHYRSDVAAGGRAGTAIAAVLFNDPEFQADRTAARRELRDALGLPQ